MLLRVTCMVALAVACLSGVARGESITLYGDQDAAHEGTNANYSATFDYEAKGSSFGLLSVSITNLTTDPELGALTGFVFNCDVDGINVALKGAPTDWAFDDFTPPPGTPVFGDFAFGASVDGDFIGGGSGSNGVMIDDGAVLFTFVVSGAGAGSLTTANFVQENELGFRMLARFKGVGPLGENSDYLPATLVPLPPVAWLALAGIGAVPMMRRRFS